VAQLSERVVFEEVPRSTRGGSHAFGLGGSSSLPKPTSSSADGTR
jgi:hypothetical protein